MEKLILEGNLKFTNDWHQFALIDNQDIATAIANYISGTVTQTIGKICGRYRMILEKIDDTKCFWCNDIYVEDDLNKYPYQNFVLLENPNGPNNRLVVCEGCYENIPHDKIRNKMIEIENKNA